MRAASIFYKGLLAGVLTESDDGYEFRYNDDYLSSPHAEPVSLTFPLSAKPYQKCHSCCYAAKTASAR